VSFSGCFPRFFPHPTTCRKYSGAFGIRCQLPLFPPTFFHDCWHTRHAGFFFPFLMDLLFWILQKPIFFPRYRLRLGVTPLCPCLKTQEREGAPQLFTFVPPPGLFEPGYHDRHVHPRRRILERPFPLLFLPRLKPELKEPARRYGIPPDGEGFGLRTMRSFCPFLHFLCPVSPPLWARPPGLIEH